MATPDHIGSAAALVRETGATTYMHALDAPLAESGGPFRPMTPGRGLIPRVAFPLVWRPNERMEPFRIDRLLVDAETLPLAGGLRVVHVPGHCAGQVAFLCLRGRLLIAGDVCMNIFGLGDPVGRVRTIHASSRHTYGAPRVHAALRAQEDRHSRKRVARLMLEAGLVGACHRGSGPTTTRRDQEVRPAPDLVGGDTITGNGGNDSLIGGSGDGALTDSIADGADVITATTDTGNDLILGNLGNDSVLIGPGANASAINAVSPLIPRRKSIGCVAIITRALPWAAIIAGCRQLQ